MELLKHGQVTMATMAMHGMGNASVGPHNGGDHNDIMFASALLTWHLIAVVLFALVEWVVVSRVYGCWRRRRSRAGKLVANVEGGGDQVEEEENLMEDVTVTRDADL